MLAVVDEGSNVVVYDLRTKEITMTEPGANSVAFNSELADMLCWSGAGMLSIKSGPFPPHQQRMPGFVVGFKGSKVFCLHYLTMSTIDVPQSATMYRYIDKRDFDGVFSLFFVAFFFQCGLTFVRFVRLPGAYRVACLGVTDADWRALGSSALLSLRLDVARRAYTRIRDVRYIDLINSLEISKAAAGGKLDDGMALGEILAYQGHFHEAAKQFSKAGGCTCRND